MIAFKSHKTIPIGRVRLGTLQRTTPIGGSFGYDRGGQRIGRYYIERFLNEHAHDVRGSVLEIGDRRYTEQFAGGRVSQSHVLHATAGNEQATIVGDLASGAGVPSDAFDCIILTQVLPFIFDLHGAVRSIYRALRPDGVVLATASGIAQISRYDMQRWGDYWRFTDLSLRRLFELAFTPANVHLHTYGNVLTSVGFLHGMAAEEFTATQLDELDPDYQLILGVRARKEAV